MANDEQATESPGAEMPRHVTIADIGDDGVRRDYTAEAGECSALARRFGLAGLGSLAGTVTAQWESGGTGVLLVTGTFTAELRQTCVVSLEPFDTSVSEDFTERFAVTPDGLIELEPDERPEERTIEEEADPTSAGVLVAGGEGLDLGELVAQRLSLAIDPYPRAPGAAFEGYSDPPDPDANPFAKLASLRDS